MSRDEGGVFPGEGTTGDSGDGVSAKRKDLSRDAPPAGRGGGGASREAGAVGDGRPGRRTGGVREEGADQRRKGPLIS
ncbi:hypothetical protein GCM10010140_34400 [Streptosporangium pseudovulgare]|uniref:Uncharacterized protein n=1 Tax=Streptosporangium pseudovulgare TaxID=35765 RepID=A0ABQ2QX76_9ACTN|nr:hypothetical protein GCM10010140_34400 [Streptosporangium pseudovulgare]